MHSLGDLTFESMTEGQEASFRTKVSEQDLRNFAELAMDYAPVHFDEDTAQKMGFDHCMAHGLFVLSRFSGLIGMVLPGARAIIHSGSYKFRRPVFAGDDLEYA